MTTCPRHPSFSDSAHKSFFNNRMVASLGVHGQTYLYGCQPSQDSEIILFHYQYRSRAQAHAKALLNANPMVDFDPALDAARSSTPDYRAAAFAPELKRRLKLSWASCNSPLLVCNSGGAGMGNELERYTQCWHRGQQFGIPVLSAQFVVPRPDENAQRDHHGVHEYHSVARDILGMATLHQ